MASGLGPDAGGLDAVESQAVVDLLNDELARLLRMKLRDFWKEGTILWLYLQFRGCFFRSSSVRTKEAEVIGGNSM